MKKLVYIFGSPIEQSLSPQMHNAAYLTLGLQAQYEYLKKEVLPAELSVAVGLLRGKNVAGANITVPHKEAVIKYLDELDLQAQKIGAVNTIVNNNGKMVGYNTDAPGYLKSLQYYNSFEPKDKKIAVFGAGGAARAIVYALAEAGAVSIAIGNRTKENALALAQEFSTIFNNVKLAGFALAEPAFLQEIAVADLVVNTTIMGMSPLQKTTPLKEISVINAKQLYSDIVYKPQKTLFLKNALKQGAQVNYGYGMLLWQGVIAFSHFTSLPLRKVPVNVMERELLI